MISTILQIMGGGGIYTQNEKDLLVRIMDKFSLKPTGNLKFEKWNDGYPVLK
jgi:hypothetical protein